MTREEYRKEMILEQDKQELANNCRLAINSFFARFKPKIEKEVYYTDILKILEPLRNKGVSLTWADSKWFIYDIEAIKEIRKFSWWKEGKGGLNWEGDRHDCDDFAEFSKSLFAIFWDTNSMGRCTGVVTYNGVSTPHAFNIILAVDNDGIVKPYLFDTQYNIEPTLLTSNAGKVNLTSWTITNIRI